MVIYFVDQFFKNIFVFGLDLEAKIHGTQYFQAK